MAYTIVQDPTGEERLVEIVPEEEHRTQKVWIGVSIEVDVTALEQEYGNPMPTAADVRREVRDSVIGVLAQVLYPEDSKIVLNVRETK